jgi:predicted nucleic acid-binding protein
MNKALLDTDIYSEILRGVNATVAAHALAYRQAHGRLTLSVITVMEMVKGLQKVQRPQKIVTLLANVATEEVLEFGQPAAEMAGRIWGDLERTGQPIGLADPMIAAIALVHGLELVTGNTSDFQRVQSLGYPLTLSDWRIP